MSIIVHTVDNDLISISALNTDDSEVIESMLPHVVTKVSLQRPESVNNPSTEHDVAGMTAKLDTTFENSGVISKRLFSCNTSMTSAAVFIDFSTWYFLESVEQALVYLKELLFEIIVTSN